MWTENSTIQEMSNVFLNMGNILEEVLPTILIAAVGLVGLGFAWRHLKKYVTGKKF